MHKKPVCKHPLTQLIIERKRNIGVSIIIAEYAAAMEEDEMTAKEPCDEIRMTCEEIRQENKLLLSVIADLHMQSLSLETANWRSNKPIPAYAYTKALPRTTEPVSVDNNKYKKILE